jgi:hypothetical protein
VPVWAVLMIARVVQALRVEIAGGAQVDIFSELLGLDMERQAHCGQGARRLPYRRCYSGHQSA